MRRGARSYRLGLDWRPLSLAFGVAFFIDRCAPVEWTFPHCNNAWDGPASAVFGFPLPYERWTMATSLVYEFVPESFILNTLFVASLLLLTTNGVLALLWGRWRRQMTLWAGRVGLALCLWFTLTYLAVLSLGFWVPTTSVFLPTEDGYSSLRPVGLSLGHDYDCTPSEFWFGSEK